MIFGAKHAFLREGLGWGHMPLPVVEEDIACGILVPIAVEGLATRAVSADVCNLSCRRATRPRRPLVDRSPESAEDAVKAAGQGASSDQVPAHPWLNQRRPEAREWCDFSA